MKPIKAATFYSMELPDTEQMRQHLQTRAFSEIGAAEAQRTGFAPIEDTGEMVIDLPEGFAFGFRIDTKILPASAVNAALKERIAKIEAEQEFKVGRKYKRELKEEVLLDMLPKALVKTTNLTVVYHRDTKLLVVPTASKATADAVTSAMVQAIESIKAETIYVSSARHGLTTRLEKWLADEDDCDAFGEFEPVDKIILKQGGMSVSVTADDLRGASEGLTEALGRGLSVDAIRLYHSDQSIADVGMSFLLGSDFRMRSVDFGAKPEKKAPDQDLIEHFQHEASVQLLHLVAAVEHLKDLLGYKPPVEETQEAA